MLEYKYFIPKGDNLGLLDRSNIVKYFNLLLLERTKLNFSAKSSLKFRPFKLITLKNYIFSSIKYDKCSISLSSKTWSGLITLSI
jgi:hypothetical protein